MKKLIWVLGICAAFSAIEAQEVWDRVLAIVDDNIVLESDVLMYAQSLALQNRQDPMKYLQDEGIKQKILQELIDHQVLLAKAKEDTVVIEDREIDREMDSRLKMLLEEVGSESELERIYGMPMREIRRELERNIRDGLMVDRVKQKKMFNVKVSRADVEEIFKENKKEFSDLPEKVELAHILLKIEPSQAAEQRAVSLVDSLCQAIAAGADFENLAQEFSQDLGSAKKGGMLGWTERGDFVPEFEKPAFELEKGEVSSPVKSRFGYHIIRLNDRQGEKINTSHILIQLRPTKGDRDRVVGLADSLYSLLKEGADFADLARQFSQDESSAEDGGNLGDFSVRELIPLYADKLKSLKAGEFTSPFASDLGVQILKVFKREKPRAMTLEQDWETISQFALNVKREKVYKEWVDKLKDSVYIEVKGK